VSKNLILLAFLFLPCLSIIMGKAGLRFTLRVEQQWKISQAGRMPQACKSIPKWLQSLRFYQ
jgi:hypothetical protein